MHFMYSLQFCPRPVFKSRLNPDLFFFPFPPPKSFFCKSQNFFLLNIFGIMSCNLKHGPFRRPVLHVSCYMLTNLVNLVFQTFQSFSTKKNNEMKKNAPPSCLADFFIFEKSTQTCQRSKRITPLYLSHG